MHSAVRILLVTLVVVLSSCRGHENPEKQKTWTERDLLALEGKTREEVRGVLGTPNGFYTRNAEGRWHYSNLFLDPEGSGAQPRRVWIVIYFSQFGDQRATLVEVHEHAKEDHSH